MGNRQSPTRDAPLCIIQCERPSPLRNKFEKYTRMDDSDEYSVAMVCLQASCVPKSIHKLLACLLASRGVGSSEVLWKEIVAAITLFEGRDKFSQRKYFFTELSDEGDSVTRRSLVKALHTLPECEKYKMDMGKVVDLHGKQGIINLKSFNTKVEVIITSITSQLNTPNPTLRS